MSGFLVNFGAADQTSKLTFYLENLILVSQNLGTLGILLQNWTSPVN